MKDLFKLMSKNNFFKSKKIINKKCQTQIVSTVLITGLLLSVVSVTYIWGKPLIQKVSDNAKIESRINKLNEIDKAIKDVADTGSPNTIEITLENDESISINDEGELVYTTITAVPLVTTYDWGPINFVESPYTNEKYSVDTTTAMSSGYKQCKPTNVYKGEVNLTYNSEETEEYNVLVFNGEKTPYYDYVCLTKDLNDFDCNQNCGYVDEPIILGNTSFQIFYVNETGKRVNIIGREILKTGELGTDDPEGIIVGRAILSNEKYFVTFKLVYRPLKDPNTGNTHQIILNCEKDCFVGPGEHNIYLSLIEKPQGTLSTNEYNINIRVI